MSNKKCPFIFVFYLHNLFIQDKPTPFGLTNTKKKFITSHYPMSLFLQKKRICNIIFDSVFKTAIFSVFWLSN